MADRSIVVRLRAEVAGFRTAMNEAAAATRRTNEEGQRANTTMGRMVQSAQRNRAEWDQAGRTMMAFGVIAAGAFVASVKAAIDWETAWTGVVKTVDGTTAQMAELETGLRNMTRILPASHAEIAKVGEVAGQLGIATPNILAFTRVMIDLGETTNLSAEEAATALARFMGVMGTAQDKVSNLGSAVVALGNNFPTTEAEIVSMAQRLAAASKVVGLSEADALGLATAMSAVGIEAEAGGTAMSRVMIKIAKAVDEGGQAVGEFATVAGMSSADFTKAWDSDPVTAIMAVVDGLGRMSDAGEGTFQALTDLGLQDVRVTNAMLSLAASGDQVTRAIDLASDAWEDNTALAHEAGLRYDTTAAKIGMAKNSVVEMGISMGEAFLPAVNAALGSLSSLSEWFGGLPSWAQTTVGGLTGITGAVALMAGAFFLGLPRIIETRAAFMTMVAIAPRVAGAMAMIGKAAGVVGAAVGIIYLTEAINKLARGGTSATTSVEEVTAAILKMNAASLDPLFDLGGRGVESIDGVTDAMDALLGGGFTDKANRFASTLDNVFGVSLVKPVADSKNAFESYSKSLAALVEGGHAEKAAESLALLYGNVDQSKYSMEDLTGLMPEYTDALASVDNQQILAGESGAAMTEQQSALSTATAEATEAQIKWRESLLESAAAFFSFGGAYDELVQKQIDGAQATADATKSTGDVWQDYYDGQTINIDDYVAKLQEQLDAQAAWQTNMTTIAAQVSQETFDELSKLGPEYAGLIDQLAKEPERLKDIDGMFNTGAVNANAFADGIESIYMPELAIDATAEPALTVATDLQNELNNRGLAVPPWAIDANAAPAIGTAGYLQNIIDAKGAAVPDWMIDADTGPAILAADGAVASINDKTASIEVSANTGLATALTEKWMAAFSGKSITVGVRAATGPGGQGGQTFAGGGGVSGPGTGTSDSIPALLSNGEHVFTADDVQKAGGQSGVYRLRQAIQAGNLPAFASGGAVGEAFSDRAARLREWEAAYQRSLSVIGTDQYSGAKAVEEAAERAFEAATKRVERLQATAADAATQVRRGEVTAQASGGLSGAYSVVDRLSSMATSGDYGAGNAAMLAAAAQVGEKAFKSLYSSAEGIESKLKDARDRVSELGSISSGVASKLTGEFSLTDGLTKQNTNAAGDIWFTQSSISAGAASKAAAIKSFAGKLASLQKMGLSGAVLQEVASLGSVEGGRVADTLLAGGKGEVASLNAAYADIAKWSTQAGQITTEGFYKGGLQAANGLVAGLSSQQAAVEKQITNLAHGMENALKIALGIRSPSKKTTRIGEQTGDGLIVGGRARIAGIKRMARDMAAAAVPDVAAVSAPVWASPMGYGSSSSSTPVQVNANIDKGAMSAALDGVSLTLMVDGSPVRAIVRTEMSTAAVAVSRGY